MNNSIDEIINEYDEQKAYSVKEVHRDKIIYYDAQNRMVARATLIETSDVPLGFVTYEYLGSSTDAFHIVTWSFDIDTNISTVHDLSYYNCEMGFLIRRQQFVSFDEHNTVCFVDLKEDFFLFNQKTRQWDAYDAGFAINCILTQKQVQEENKVCCVEPLDANINAGQFPTEYIYMGIFPDFVDFDPCAD